jgi:multimeric flavodoxin WrbA
MGLSYISPSKTDHIYECEIPRNHGGATMRVISIFGGPRKKGNTATVLGWVEEELKNLGHEVDRVNVVDYKIAGCMGCHHCQGVLDERSCVQKDDTLDILRRWMDADAAILASPQFDWSFPAQLKALLDRTFCLVKAFGGSGYKSLLEGEKVALLLTCAGPKEGNADLVVEQFNRITSYGRMVPVADLVVPFCITPDKLGEEAKAEAKALAERMAG